MTKRTYTIMVNANALRSITVRANSGREALDITWNRIKPRTGPWAIDFPGGEDEHFSVEDDQGNLIGPDAQGGFEDEENEDEEGGEDNG